MIRASSRPWIAFGWALSLALGASDLALAQPTPPDEPVQDSPSLQPGRGEVAPSVSYGPTAEANFLEGEKAFEEEQYLAAQRFFGYIRSKFPYSRFAVLAELRIADCQYERKRFLEAIDSYQNFLRLHPTHDKAAYARFRVGKSYFNQIPSNFFLLPPAYEKDQSAVKDAEKALRAYVQQHPEGDNKIEANKILSEVRNRLMAHERYVADFYRNLDRDRAYVGRLEIIRTQFADVGLDDELLLEITDVWARLGEGDKARSAVAEMKAKFPDSERLSEAESLLSSLPGPAAAPNEKTAPPKAKEPKKAKTPKKQSTGEGGRPPATPDS